MPDNAYKVTVKNLPTMLFFKKWLWHTTTERLQYCAAHNILPLCVCVDQEGGIVGLAVIAVYSPLK